MDDQHSWVPPSQSVKAIYSFDRLKYFAELNLHNTLVRQRAEFLLEHLDPDPTGTYTRQMTVEYTGNQNAVAGKLLRQVFEPTVPSKLTGYALRFKVRSAALTELKQVVLEHSTRFAAKIQEQQVRTSIRRHRTIHTTQIQQH